MAQFIMAPFEARDVAQGAAWERHVRDVCPGATLVAAVRQQDTAAVKRQFAGAVEIVEVDGEVQAARWRALARVRLLRHAAAVAVESVVWFVDPGARPARRLLEIPEVRQLVTQSAVTFLPFWPGDAGRPAIRGVVVEREGKPAVVEDRPHAAPPALIPVLGGDLGCAAGTVAAFSRGRMHPGTMRTRTQWVGAGGRAIGAAPGAPVTSESVGWCQTAAGRVPMFALIEPGPR